MGGFQPGAFQAGAFQQGPVITPVIHGFAPASPSAGNQLPAGTHGQVEPASVPGVAPPEGN